MDHRDSINSKQSNFYVYVCYLSTISVHIAKIRTYLNKIIILIYSRVNLYQLVFYKKKYLQICLFVDCFIALVCYMVNVCVYLEINSGFDYNYCTIASIKIFWMRNVLKNNLLISFVCIKLKQDFIVFIQYYLLSYIARLWVCKILISFF